jgi:cytoskeletal protein CcmA (bactofilin family)
LLKDVTTGPATSTSPTCQENVPAKFYLESSPGSDCQVSFEGVLHIEGHLAGKIRSFNCKLLMPAQVKIESDIEVGAAQINGRLTGNINASQRVVLQSQARVEGNINTPSLSISEASSLEEDSVFLGLSNRDRG